MLQRSLHVTVVCSKVQSGRYKITPKRDRPLTYEMANPPHFIADRKAWNSWDVCKWSKFIWLISTVIKLLWTITYRISTANLQGGLRSSETAIEDVFIRRFITGTFHSLVCSEVIIKRQHNHIRIACIMKQALPARKIYFLIGYTEELLASWLQCPITLELQTISDSRDVIFKYI